MDAILNEVVDPADLKVCLIYLLLKMNNWRRILALFRISSVYIYWRNYGNSKYVNT